LWVPKLVERADGPQYLTFVSLLKKAHSVGRETVAAELEEH
jgi:hypothetical protein